MPILITSGSRAQFIVEYLSSTGEQVVPASGTLEVTYRQNRVETTDTVTLTAENSFFTGIWGSSDADLGNVTWEVNAPGVSSPARTGTIKLIAAVT